MRDGEIVNWFHLWRVGQPGGWSGEGCDAGRPSHHDHQVPNQPPLNQSFVTEDFSSPRLNLKYRDTVISGHNPLWLSLPSKVSIWKKVVAALCTGCLVLGTTQHCHTIFPSEKILDAMCTGCLVLGTDTGRLSHESSSQVAGTTRRCSRSGRRSTVGRETTRKSNLEEVVNPRPLCAPAHLE